MLTSVIYVLLLLICILFAILMIKVKKVRVLQNELRETIHTKNVLSQYNQATNTSNIISKSDLEGNITYVNDKFCEVSQYTKEEVIGLPHSILRAEENDKIFENMWNTIKSGKVWKGKIKNKKKDGTLYYIDSIISPVFDEAGNTIEYIAIRHEITDLVLKTNELNRILREDYLTKVGSRYNLIEDIANMKNPVISLMDINNFSEVNDFFGYKIGDNILKLIAKRIEDLLIHKRAYKVYRLTSDVFAILATNVEKYDFIKEVEGIAKQVVDKPFLAEGREVNIQLSCSFSFEEKSVLLETANSVRKYSKTNKNKIIYDKNLDIEKDYEKNIFWNQKIKKALETDGIIPYFQAIYNLKTNKIEKYEALMRLNDFGKVVSPYLFLDISKKSGQYSRLTKRMIRKTFDYFKNNDYEFSLNLTFEDISMESTYRYVIDNIKKYNLASRIVIEIVESEKIQDFSLVNHFFEEIKELGCKIAIDDFGSGYSNFEYLIKLEADYIKIDGSLIKDILVNKGNENVIRMIIKFAKDKGIKTIAEFVSSKEIFDKVKELGVDYAQGYYIQEPFDKIE